MAKIPAEMPEQKIARLHQEACEKGRKYYRDPVTKVRVNTADFLLSRGRCCNCECRHCPFPEGPNGGPNGQGHSRPCAAEAVV